MDGYNGIEKEATGTLLTGHNELYTLGLQTVKFNDHPNRIGINGSGGDSVAESFSIHTLCVDRSPHAVVGQVVLWCDEHIY